MPPTACWPDTAFARHPVRKNPPKPSNRAGAGGNGGEINPGGKAKPARLASLLIRGGELALPSTFQHLPHSHASAYYQPEPLRTRKLAGPRREIDKLRIALDQKGLT